LIYVVRDPIERIRSHYQHRVLSGAVPPALPARARAPGDVRTASLVPSRDAAIRLGFLGIDPTFVSDVIDQESYRSEESAAYPPIAWWLPRTVKRYSRPGSGSRR